MRTEIRTRTRMDRVQAPIIPVVGRIVAQVPGTISLGQGVVHYAPPPAAIAAAHAAAAERATHEYQSGSGETDLVDAIRLKLHRENRLDGRGSQVMVTAGSNMAFMHAVLAVSEAGDEVILPSPFYFNHEMAIDMAGCRAVPVATDASHQLDVEAVAAAITERTRAIVTISPNNPSGAVYAESSLKAIGELCRARGLYHISDETYEYFTYGRVEHVSPASLADAGAHTISLFSLSKAYGFAGWRIGYAVYPEALHDAMLKIQDTVLICPTVIAQRAAFGALNVGRSYCETYRRELEDVRRFVLDALGSLGPLCTVPPADGAFYVFPRVHVDLDPMTLTERLIREHRVAVTPGSAFGVKEGCTFRVAFGALQRETVEEGVGRLVAGLRAICSTPARRRT